MKKGTKVRTTFDGKVGTSMGLRLACGVWWVLTRWPDGTQSLVSEQSLEVVGEDWRFG
tara:strand:- start:629 stop:802 length:174 start_codon:yes stop_codon:yes gene_type:complete